MSTSKRAVIIIVPCYNEEQNIGNVIKQLDNIGYDYIIINDGSNDDSIRVIKNTTCNYIDLPNNLGIGGAVQTGYKYALLHDYDIAIQVDGDGQHNVNDIVTLISVFDKENIDMAIGSRFIDDDGFKSTRARIFGIKILSLALRLFTGNKINDITSGFRCVNKSVMRIFAQEYPHEYPEPITNFLLCQRGMSITEVAVNMNERVGGKSSIGGINSIYYMLNVLLQFIVLSVFKRR